jgi:large subunit ribosomal protein L19
MAKWARWKETEFGVGDTVRVHQQDSSFEGLVIKIKGRQENKTFTVRKIGVDSIGVEKIFPFLLPTITKLEVVTKAKKVRRAKLYYLRKKK